MKQATTTTTTNTTKQQRPQHHGPEEEDLFREGARPNEGVGYVGDKAKRDSDATAKEDRLLRGKLLGNRRTAADEKKRGGKGQQGEDEDDEEPGRSALGKRKRPKRAVDEVEEHMPVVTETEEQAKQEQVNGSMEQTQATTQDIEMTPAVVQDHTTTLQKKKKKKNKKKKQAGEN